LEVKGRLIWQTVTDAHLEGYLRSELVFGKKISGYESLDAFEVIHGKPM
jgi:hypothetical protein